MPHAADEHDADALRRSLDRAVTRARAARLLGWLGRTACIAVIAIVVTASIDLALRPAGFPLGRLAVAAATLLAAVVVWRRWIEPVPRRLDAARAAEAAHPHLGEQVSRTIGFLDAAGGGSPTSRMLEQLAVAQAAAALRGIDRVPTPGLRRHGPWIAAGCGGLACLLASVLVAPRPWRDAVHRQIAFATAAPAEKTSGAEPAAVPATVSSAAVRIAAAAAVETNLAAILARRFAHAPGLEVDALAPAERRDLDRLAGIHAEVMRGIHADRTVFAEHGAATPGAAAAETVLATVDHDPTAVAAAISTNRLAAAAAATARTARRLAEAARHLGVSIDPAGTEISALPAAATGADRRRMADLAEIAARPLAPEAAAGTTAAAATSGPAPTPGAPAGAATSGDEAGPPPRTEGVATAEPRFGTGAAGEERSTEPAPAAVLRDRVWTLLPPRSRPFDARDGQVAVPDTYRPAVDRYYRLLLESMTSDRPRSLPQAVP